MKNHHLFVLGLLALIRARRRTGGRQAKSDGQEVGNDAW